MLPQRPKNLRLLVPALRNFTNFAAAKRKEMKTLQTEIRLAARPRGFHLITREVMAALPPLPRAGLLNLFVKHTSCGLCVNENADPDVRRDLRAIFDGMVPEGRACYTHTMEGPDDMPSHAKSVLTGVSLTLPITGGRLNLGTWQGIYLCEYRDCGGPRTLVATIIGEGGDDE